ncbi:MAG TPA: TspO/MBR family protein [Chthoniobacterales bacterium]|nr:TspO/MBR family protein [Chthoniobacterales bacterium]
MTRAIVLSLVICIIGAVLEGLFAGTEVKQRLAAIRLPKRVPPFWLWVVIGALYYLTCFGISMRLLILSTSPSRTNALALLATIMFVNALWNYFFFRSRNFKHAYFLGLVYSAFVLLLFVLVMRLDSVAAWLLCPYMIYLFYGNAWGYRVWKLNPRPMS